MQIQTMVRVLVKSNSTHDVPGTVSQGHNAEVLQGGQEEAQFLNARCPRGSHPRCPVSFLFTTLRTRLFCSPIRPARRGVWVYKAAWCGGLTTRSMAHTELCPRLSDCRDRPAGLKAESVNPFSLKVIPATQ